MFHFRHILNYVDNVFFIYLISLFSASSKYSPRSFRFAFSFFFTKRFRCFSIISVGALFIIVLESLFIFSSSLIHSVNIVKLSLRFSLPFPFNFLFSFISNSCFLDCLLFLVLYLIAFLVDLISIHMHKESEIKKTSTQNCLIFLIGK